MLYQPIISRKDNTIAAAKALIRWRKRENEAIYPGDFIPITEDSELIIGVGEYVICQLLRQLSDYHSQRFIAKNWR